MEYIFTRFGYILPTDNHIQFYRVCVTDRVVCAVIYRLPAG